MKRKIVIFDLDGTLIDIEYFVDAINKLSSTLNYKKLSKSDIKKLRNTRSIHFNRIVGIPIWKMPLLILKVKKMLKYEVENMHFVTGIEDMLLSLRKKDVMLGVITSNSRRNTVLFFEKYKKKFFDFRVSGAKIFGKQRNLRRIAKDFDVDMENLFYIGDETRDIVAAKKAGAKIISVTWGLNAEEILAKMEPDYIANKPKDILNIIKGNV
jgi:HAD superfamily hydrolase (TIGR01549 family)